MKYYGSNTEIQELVLNFKDHSNLSEVMVFDEPNGLIKMESPGNCVLLTDQIPPNQLLSLISENKTHHVIQLSNLDYKRNFSNAATLMADKKKIFENPVSIFLDGDNVQESRVMISQSPKKDEISNQIRDFLELVPKGKTIKDSALIVAHELLINVMYDAPKYYFEKYKKTRSFQNITDPAGEIIMAYDDKKLLMGAVDHYGSLNIPKLISRLNETFQEEMVNVGMDPDSGAGIGCRMMFELTTEMFFSVSENVRTFVGGCFPLGMSLRKQQMTPKNVHIVSE